MGLEQESRKHRVMDHSNRDARRAAATLEQFARWQLDLAQFHAQADRRLSDRARQSMLLRCTEIDMEVLKARTSLIIDLAEAPPTIAGNSRVVDVERALDRIQSSVEELRSKLTPSVRLGRIDSGAGRAYISSMPTKRSQSPRETIKIRRPSPRKATRSN